MMSAESNSEKYNDKDIKVCFLVMHVKYGIQYESFVFRGEGILFIVKTKKFMVLMPSNSFPDLSIVLVLPCLTCRYTDGFLGMCTMGSMLTSDRLTTQLLYTYSYTRAAVQREDIDPAAPGHHSATCDEYTSSWTTEPPVRFPTPMPRPAAAPQDVNTQVLTHEKTLNTNNSNSCQRYSSHGNKGSTNINCDIDRLSSHSHNVPMTDINKTAQAAVASQSICDSKVDSLQTTGDDEPQSDRDTALRTEMSEVAGNVEHLHPRNDIVMASSTVSVGQISGLDHKDRQPQSGSVITVELMVHPGYPCDPNKEVGGCGSGPDDFSQSQDRLHEMNVLTSSEVLNFYRHQGYRLVPSCARL